MLKKSWESNPFVDIIVQDAQVPCPSEFPEEVIYEIFPGTRKSCDCLKYENDLIYMDELCQRDTKTNEYRYPGCFDSGSLAPQIMDSINGLKYCGVRNEVSLKKMVRPIRMNESESDGRKWACPADHKPCNVYFFDLVEVNNSHDYVVCYPDTVVRE